MNKRKNKAAVTNLLDDLVTGGLRGVEQRFTDVPSSTEHLNIIELDPAECPPWKMANRKELDDASCEDIIESIKHVGQRVPAIVRKSPQGGYELIVGARRRYACQKLGKKLQVIEVDLSDKEALLAMDVENRERKDISPYERALDYENWVNSGIYKNYAEIIQEAGMKKSWFSKLIALANLDPYIVKAFRRPSALKQVWGYHLASLSKDENNLKALIAEAKVICAQKEPLAPAAVYQALLHSISPSNTSETGTEWVTDKTKKKLFKVKKSSSGAVQIYLTEADFKKVKMAIIEKLSS